MGHKLGLQNCPRKGEALCLVSHFKATTTQIIMNWMNITMHLLWSETRISRRCQRLVWSGWRFWLWCHHKPNPRDQPTSGPTGDDNKDNEDEKIGQNRFLSYWLAEELDFISKAYISKAYYSKSSPYYAYSYSAKEESHSPTYSSVVWRKAIGSFM